MSHNICEDCLGLIEERDALAARVADLESDNKSLSEMNADIDRQLRECRDIAAPGKEVSATDAVKCLAGERDALKAALRYLREKFRQIPVSPHRDFDDEDRMARIDALLGGKV